MTPVEVEAAVERLMDKLEKWLIVQPEMLMLWNADRDTRKRVCSLIAKELMIIPTREGQELNRPMRRKITREMLRAERKWWKDISLPS